MKDRRIDDLVKSLEVINVLHGTSSFAFHGTGFRIGGLKNKSSIVNHKSKINWGTKLLYSRD